MRLVEMSAWRPLVASMVALAAAAWWPAAQAGWSPQGVILETYTNTGFLLIKLAGEPHNPAGCPQSSYYGLKTDANNFRGLSAAALAAQLARREVILYVSDGVCSGQSNQYPSISSIRIMD